MKKIVYVTGCLGFIGSYVTKLCLEKGWYVIGVDKETYAANLQFLPELLAYPKFKYIKTDIRDITYLLDCDYVINTAAESHVDRSILGPAEFVQTNVVGTFSLLEETRAWLSHQAAEERAQKTAVKLMIPLVLFIFPAMMIVLGGPAMIKLVAQMGAMQNGF